MAAIRKTTYLQARRMFLRVWLKLRDGKPSVISGSRLSGWNTIAEPDKTMFDKTELLAPRQLPISNPSDEKTSIESHEKRNKRKRHRWKLVTLAISQRRRLRISGLYDVPDSGCRGDCHPFRSIDGDQRINPVNEPTALKPRVCYWVFAEELPFLCPLTRSPGRRIYLRAVAQLHLTHGAYKADKDKPLNRRLRPQLSRVVEASCSTRLS